MVITGLLYALGLAASILLFVHFLARGSKIGMLCMAALFVRVIVAVVLDSGLKYYFVLDSLGYERNAWLLAQSWITSDREFYSLPDGYLGRNLYEVFLAGIFFVFGNQPLVGVIVNILVSIATIWFIYQIHHLFFADPRDGKNNVSKLISVGLLAIYPSSLVWSATNIRDPLYFFLCVLVLYFFLQAFSPKSKAAPFFRMGAVFAMGLCFWGILGLRAYIGYLLVSGVVIGVLAGLITRIIRPRPFVIGIIAASILGAYFWQILMPQDASDFLNSIEKARLGFSNMGLDDYAQSSFALDYSFHSIGDLVLFVPIGLVNYFFAPFPWQVSSTAQAMSLVEVFSVYLLIYPTWIGIKRAFVWARFETSVIIGFIITMATAQAVIISNSGTIFRHRTLGFMLLMIFSGIGIHEIWNKNRQAVLAT